LKDELAAAVEDRLAHAGAAIERSGLTTWDVGSLPETWEGRAGRHTAKGFPALIDRGSSVDLRVLPDEAAARAQTRRGVRRLLLLGTTPPWKRVLASLSNSQKLALAQNPHGSVPALLEDCLAAAVDSIVAEHVGVDAVRDTATFEAALKSVRAHVAARVLQVVSAVEPVLALSAEVTKAVAGLANAAPRPWLPATLADVRAQHGSLIRPGFVADTGLARLPDLQRYLRAILARLDRAVANPREGELQERIDAVEAAYGDVIERLGPGSPEATSDPARDVGWMIEELRVSLFAQSLGTAYAVSEKRVQTAIRALTATG
jgi:ATP-dependent helicase HrpA